MSGSSRIRILAITDAHGRKPNLEQVLSKELGNFDLVVFCGDAAPYFNPSSVDYVLKALDSLEVPALVVPGNMDNPRAYYDTDNVRVIHGKIATHSGYSFIGIGGSPPTPFNTVFELEEEEIYRILSSLWRPAAERGPVIIVSHAPPYDTACDIAAGERHVGSRALRKFIEQYSPLLCICGHIHESRAIDRVGCTTIVNPGPLRDGFYALIEVNGFEIKKIELKKI